MGNLPRIPYGFVSGTSPVFPGVHLFHDNIGVFAHATLKQCCLLENRRANFLEVVSAEYIPHRRLHKIPQRRIRRQQIPRPSHRFNHVPFLHSVILSEARSNERAQSKDPCNLSTTTSLSGSSLDETRRYL